MITYKLSNTHAEIIASFEISNSNTKYQYAIFDRENGHLLRTGTGQANYSFSKEEMQKDAWRTLLDFVDTRYYKRYFNIKEEKDESN